MKTYTYEEKTALVIRSEKMNITFNGFWSQLGGTRLPFAQINTQHQGIVEYSWGAVERILNKGGAFGV